MKYQSEDGMITIREIQPEDAKVLMEMNNDTMIAQFVVGSPRLVTLDEQIIWMQRLKNEKNIDRFMIDFEGQAVGTIIISDINVCNKTANMNIKLLPTSWGKGIGTISIQLALDYCFNQKKLMCITAHILSYNNASIALFTKSGFKQEGVLRSRVLKNDKRCDLVSFSILKDEYEDNKK